MNETIQEGKKFLERSKLKDNDADLTKASKSK